MDDRAGKTLPPIDFQQLRDELVKDYGKLCVYKCVSIDDITFEFLEMHCSIGKGIKQKKISRE